MFCFYCRWYFVELSNLNLFSTEKQLRVSSACSNLCFLMYLYNREVIISWKLNIPTMLYNIHPAFASIKKGLEMVVVLLDALGVLAHHHWPLAMSLHWHMAVTP